MPYLIVTERRMDKAFTEETRGDEALCYAADFGTAKTLLRAMVSEEIEALGYTPFAEECCVPARDSYEGREDASGRENIGTAFFSEIAKILEKTKGNTLDSYLYEGTLVREYADALTLCRLGPEELCVIEDKKETYSEVRMNLHNMTDKGKIYFFTYKNMDKKQFLSVKMYPVTEENDGK